METPTIQPQIPSDTQLDKRKIQFDILLAVLTILLLAGQVWISQRQTGIAEDQKLISNQQMHLSARPHITSIAEGDPKGGPVQRLRIRNDGVFPVQNLRLTYLYFAKIAGKGWHVSVPVGGSRRQELKSSDEWLLEITGYGKALASPPFVSSFTVEGNMQSVVFLLSFERPIDGHGYVHLEPMNLTTNGELFSFRNVVGGPTDGISGPLAFVSQSEIELAFEYFRRRPFPGNYEIYNYEYLLGYQPTGSLGPITWGK